MYYSMRIQMSTSIACHWLLSPKSALLFPILLLVWAHFVIGTHATSLESVERGSTLGGMCFDSTVSDQPALRNLRRQIVKYNQRKSMYRDGDIIAVYKLDRPGHGSLAGCADACLLNWRLTDDTRQALDTDCSLDINSHCPMTSGILVADRKCEAFMFNRLTSVCTLLSARQSLRLTRSSNFWSGKLICEDMSSVDDWAEGVVSRRSPPPPPSRTCTPACQNNEKCFDGVCAPDAPLVFVLEWDSEEKQDLDLWSSYNLQSSPTSCTIWWGNTGDENNPVCGGFLFNDDYDVQQGYEVITYSNPANGDYYVVIDPYSPIDGSADVRLSVFKSGVKTTLLSATAQTDPLPNCQSPYTTIPDYNGYPGSSRYPSRGQCIGYTVTYP